MLLAIAAAVGGFAVLIYELDAEQRDREAVSVIVSNMESKLRAARWEWPASERGRVGAGQRVCERRSCAREARGRPRPPGPHREAVDPPGRCRSPRRRNGTVSYGVVGMPPPGDPPAPRGGQFLLQRGPEGWQLTANRFFDEVPQTGGSRRRRHRHGHAGLSGRLAAIAVLALLAAASFLVRPVAARAVRARRTRPRRR